MARERIVRTEVFEEGTGRKLMELENRELATLYHRREVYYFLSPAERQAIYLTNPEPLALLLSGPEWLSVDDYEQFLTSVEAGLSPERMEFLRNGDIVG